ncbi:valine--tRNA ligase [endosymbiont of Pachyrhynchus infernalis]|uniref:valine--tRNA ligase n=1 Tax=endosymbiont of Pachyrhynchus infernalis TaxID=1971488 RepID=UPI000DC6E975|nr:valine--tRNA ligase [endosymbiont of Pachyrhynchus infernalis]BBA84912.1 valine--tRNA ligase [endosymbiont of Pachyrhynchus infernalis]
MKKIYNPKFIENKISKLWNKNKNIIFNKNLNNNNYYSIILPPLNITGNLHIGHAFQHVIMDFLVKYNKMIKKNVLWQSGLDHAGIATQIIIEKKTNIYNNLNKNKNIKFLNKEAWILKEKVKKKIKFQTKKIGNFIDFSNSRFTLDKKFNYSVNYAFIKLYNNNLIYKDTKIVNWDTKIGSAISDLEISYKESLNKVWNIKFPLLNDVSFNNIKNNKFIIVSTTRPETILGDSAIAINPNDNRYTNLIGKKVLIPIINRIIPIIFDSSIDINKGTGCVKITPGHNINDYKIGIKNSLPIINIFNKNGKINEFLELIDINNKLKYNLEKVPTLLQNKTILESREIIVKELLKLNLIDSINNEKIIIPYSNKSNSIVENLITNQWFLKTKEISLDAINVIKNKDIEFIPKKYENTYFNWMKNIEDWCISRQIWWGHNIPAWYDNNNNIYVGFNEIYIRKKFNLSKSLILKKDNDVLDTWFSSSLFIFSSLGWPKSYKKIKKFYPTSIIISGFDIIFFWISRIIMMSIYFMKDNKNIKNIVPFNKIYITGLINDENGYKMSKSNGNIIDPIDIINGISLEKLIIKRTSNLLNKNKKELIIKSTTKEFPNGIKSYGADSLRYGLIKLSYSNNKNIKLNINLIDSYNKFCNKLWNVSLFVIKNTNYTNYNKIELSNIKLDINKWILVKLNILIKNINIEINNYRLDVYGELIYKFIKNEFCNWYIEFSKILIEKKQEIEEIKYFLKYILINIIKISHPIIPFITEEISQKLNINKLLIQQDFPKFNNNYINLKYTYKINIIKEIIKKIRNIKSKITNNNFKIIINNIKIELNENDIYIISKFVNIYELYINYYNYNYNNIIYKDNLINDIKIIFLT